MTTADSSPALSPAPRIASTSSIYQTRATDGDNNLEGADAPTIVDHEKQSQDKVEELIEELELELDEDFDLGGIRERRMQEMRDQ